jgi:D-serine deaminase-like pyridoxal phosphate-dependent protein
MDHPVLDHRLAGYSIADLSAVLTPALAVYAGNVAHNIETTIALLGNNPARWRPHLKTTKLAYVMRMLAARGVQAVKCATTLELSTACEVGFNDVLLAYPVSGSNAARVAEIALAFPQVAISALVDSPRQLDAWARSQVSLFLDVDPGMNRTGIPHRDLQQIVQLAQRIIEYGIRFRGLHYYDGHLTDAGIEARTKKAHAGYDHVLNIVRALEAAGVPVEEVITTGTPTFPCALSYTGFVGESFTHRVSPGTLVFSDLNSQAFLPESFGYRLAALVLSRVVSAGAPERFSCDAGHKSVSVDPGIPNCTVLGWEGLTPSRPSEEHLPISVAPGAEAPELGEILYLAPKHVCPTVNNFSHALILQDGNIVGVEAVSARGHEGPIWHANKEL